jgi:hypothetical protein
LARIRVSGVIDSEVAAELYRLHEERLARLKTFPVEKRRWNSSRGLSDPMSFSATFEEVLKAGLPQPRNAHTTEPHRGPLPRWGRSGEAKK